MGAAVAEKPSQLSTVCSLCQTCFTVCAKDALKLSFGFDLGGKDLLRERERVEASHEELVLLVEAGLSPYEAIEAGTRNAALVLGHSDDFGTVAPGKRADLLLLNANPLEDVTNASKISGVMVRGRWLPQGELQFMLDGLKDSFEPSLLERLWPLALCLLTACAAIRVFRRT